MLWDVLVVLSVLIWAVVGWNIGIINSWRGPLALVVATMGTQKLYIDAATSLVGHLRMDPPMAVAISYTVMWFLFYLFSEIILRVVLPFGSKSRPIIIGRVLGAMWGMVAAGALVLLPTMASIAPIAIPPAAQDKANLTQPIDSGVQNSTLIPQLKHFGQDLYANVGQYVTSTSGPSFKPDYPIDDQSQSSSQ